MLSLQMINRVCTRCWSGLQREQETQVVYVHKEFTAKTRNTSCVRTQRVKQNEAQSARAESTHKGVNLRSKDVTETKTTETRVSYGNSHLACEYIAVT